MLFWKRFVHRPGVRLPQCHAATIEALPDGRLVSAWYAGAYERARDVAIYGATLLPGAEEWEWNGTFADTPGLSEGNPVLYADAERLWLFYVTMLGERWDTCQVKYAHAVNGGTVWESPNFLRSDWGWMTGCKPLLLPENVLLLPLYEESGSAFVLRSEDGGREWSQSNVITTPYGVIQPTLASLADGKLLMYLRSFEKKNGAIWQSFSEDAGQTWQKPTRTSLPNPNSRIDLTRLASGRLALAFNETQRGRTPLTLALSEDEGATWPYRADVETGEGEFSYPALIQSQNGLLQLVYTYQRTHIAHITCDEEWIMGHSRVSGVGTSPPGSVCVP